MRSDDEEEHDYEEDEEDDDVSWKFVAELTDRLSGTPRPARGKSTFLPASGAY